VSASWLSVSFLVSELTVSKLVCQRVILSDSWLSASWHVSELVCQRDVCLPVKIALDVTAVDIDLLFSLQYYFSSVFTNEWLDNIPKLESLYPDMPMFTVTVPCVFKLFFKINRSHRITSLCTFVLIIVHQIKRWTICSAVTIIVVTIFIATFQNIVSYLYRDISCVCGAIYLRSTCAMAALFYSPVDFTDASDLHQTVVKFIGWCSGCVVKFIGESIDSIGVEDRCTKLLSIATIYPVKQRLSEQQLYDIPMYNK